MCCITAYGPWELQSTRGTPAAFAKATPFFSQMHLAILPAQQQPPWLVLPAQLCHAARIPVGHIVSNHALDALGLAQGKLKGHPSPPVMAHEHRFLDAEIIQDARQHLSGEPGEGVGVWL